MMRQLSWAARAVSILVLAVMLAACAPAALPADAPDDDPAAQEPGDEVTGTPEPTADENLAPTIAPFPTPVVGSAPEETEPAESTEEPMTNPTVQQAVADLAERLNVPESAIEVVSFEAVVWPDGSLGCPQPGMAYTQVQVDGARTVLEYDGETYEYHSGGSREPFLCEQAQLFVPEPPLKGTDLFAPPKGTDEMVPPPGYDD